MSAQIVTIAQPTFLPWAGWFDLADQADLLIILDDVAFSKQSWQQRNRLRTREGLSYVTVPVISADRFGQHIMDTELAGDAFVQKLLRTVAQNYSRAAYFGERFPEFSEVLTAAAASTRLADLNCALIGWLAEQLGVKTPRVRASSLSVDGKRGAHVAKLCERVGANRYLSAAGAEEYLQTDRAEFDARAISIELQEYQHPEYRQCFQPFIPYASALDLVFNEGVGAGAIMRSGRRVGRAIATPTVVQE
jgi:WbqC-like protein family